MRFTRQVIPIEDQVRFHAEVDQHAHAVEREVDVLARGLLLRELDRAGDCAAVQPAVGVDADYLPGEFAQVGGLLDALEEREEAWGVSCWLVCGFGVGERGGDLPVMPIVARLWSPKAYEMSFTSSVMDRSARYVYT